MKKVLENIRNSPPHHRDRVVWVCAAIAAAILLIIWLIVGNGRKTTPDQNFFQSFQSGVDDGKAIVPQPDNATNINSINVNQ